MILKTDYDVIVGVHVFVSQAAFKHIHVVYTNVYKFQIHIQKNIYIYIILIYCYAYRSNLFNGSWKTPVVPGQLLSPLL